MRHLKMTVALAVAAGVLAIAAAPAMAHQFVASHLGKSTGRGFEQIPLPPPGELPEYNPARMQNFKFGNFKIRCYGASGSGQITELASETFQTTTKYTRCGWYPQENSLHASATFSKSGITVTYHANGYLQAEGNESGEEVEWRNIGLKEVSAAIHIGQKICTVTIPEQTVPARAVISPNEEFSAAVYSTFPGAGGHLRLKIQNSWKNVKFVYTGEGNQCTAEEFKTKGEGGGGLGTYNGKLEESIYKGDLRWE
jgi:hypothetical protein